MLFLSHFASPSKQVAYLNMRTSTLHPSIGSLSISRTTTPGLSSGPLLVPDNSYPPDPSIYSQLVSFHRKSELFYIPTCSVHPTRTDASAPIPFDNACFRDNNRSDKKADPHLCRLVTHSAHAAFPRSYPYPPSPSHLSKIYIDILP